jgi:outer membrane protein W
MKTARWLLVLFFVVLLSSESAYSQAAPLKSSSALELNFGLWGEGKAGQELTLGGIRTSANTSGFSGNLTYCYWLREYAAVTITGAFLSAEATSNVGFSGFGAVQQTASSVVSFLVGMRYYIPSPDPEDDVRPYLAAGVGSFMGFEASNSLLAQSAHSESAFGGRVGGGVDVFLGNIVKLGAGVGYNAMVDFRTSVGARTNYNGFDASIGIGFVFGR